MQCHFLFCNPDIDECLEGLHGCQENAECVDTKGGYTCACSCEKGLVGEDSSCDRGKSQVVSVLKPRAIHLITCESILRQRKCDSIMWSKLGGSCDSSYDLRVYPTSEEVWQQHVIKVGRLLPVKRQCSGVNRHIWRHVYGGAEFGIVSWADVVLRKLRMARKTKLGR